jgi:protease YdgD
MHATKLIGALISVFMAVLLTTAFPAAAQNFGDDAGIWSNDGECDDPRFVGTGMATTLDPADVGHDASDCRSLFESGQIRLSDKASDKIGTTPTTSTGMLDYGDDTGTYANDGECDDPRFTGPGASDGLYGDHLMHDASDCRDAMAEGTVSLFVDPGSVDISGIDFGNDNGSFANDAECDDPRFTGPGASDGFDSHILEDASDCREAMLAGTVTMTGDPGSPDDTGSIDYGDNSGAWANDGECDDPRFEGAGSSGGFDDHEMHDANDCLDAVLAGTVTLVRGPSGPVSGGDIDFGDDAGEYSRDGECDDPRFEGPGVGVPFDDHEMHDASDCRDAFNAGTVTYEGGPSGPVSGGDIDFGDDEGEYSRDGECDDPRFEGPGIGIPFGDHEMHDATDCRDAFNDGTVTLMNLVNSSGIDFGDDNGEWSNDGECDDPRFEGEGSSGGFDDHLRHDATDCRVAFERGDVTLIGGPSSGDQSSGSIEYGDDSGAYANDDECDDPRFEGPGTSGGGFDDHEMHDASDCRDAVAAGTATFNGPSGGPSVGSIDYGDNSGEWANDGECDDPRFTGSGASGGFDSHLMHDANDCRDAMAAGTVSFDGPTGSSTGAAIDYGDDSGEWANDGECDDPRFTGSGASAGFDSHLMHDASDCRDAFIRGTVTIDGQSSTSGGPFDYGDDDSVFANDGECDDPRFEGPSMDNTLLAVDMGHDATDCRNGVQSGDISIRSQFQ